MKRSVIVWFSVLFLASLPALSSLGEAQNNNSHNPTWWDKYQFILNNGSDGSAGITTSESFGTNVDVSNECGPQSETFITIDPNKTKTLAAGSNEIFRLPMRGYFSSNGGTSWGGVDLPLPPAKSAFGPSPILSLILPMPISTTHRVCPLCKAWLAKYG